MIMQNVCTQKKRAHPQEDGFLRICRATHSPSEPVSGMPAAQPSPVPAPGQAIAEPYTSLPTIPYTGRNIYTCVRSTAPYKPHIKTILYTQLQKTLFFKVSEI